MSFFWLKKACFGANNEGPEYLLAQIITYLSTKNEIEGVNEKERSKSDGGLRGEEIVGFVGGTLGAIVIGDVL